ncbi:MAG: hypothetical protein ACPIOQ_56000 [Promethearchaeia archaeon]
MRRGWLDILSSIDGGDDMVETAAMLSDNTLDPWDWLDDSAASAFLAAGACEREPARPAQMRRARVLPSAMVAAAGSLAGAPISRTQTLPQQYSLFTA